MNIFEYDEEKELALFRVAEREEGFELGLEQGLAQGLAQGLHTLIHTLQKLSLDKDTIYKTVIANQDYANLTWEEFEKFLEK